MIATTPRLAAASTLAAFLFLSCSTTNAFAPVVAPRAVVGSHERSSASPLFMAEGEDFDATVTVNARKEIGYDEKSGRFFETDLEAEECIPEDEYCVVDKSTGDLVQLTLEEKERIFLDSLQAYYVSGRQLLEDGEFDLLKEDLSWNGSELVNLNRKEAQYLAAMQAYVKGDTILTDGEFDQLKKELKEDGSKFAITTEPKCYIDTGICTVTYQKDNFRSNLLYLPVGGILSLVWLGFGFEVIEPFIRLNPLILAALGAPLIYTAAPAITDNLIFTENDIVYGPCPSCGADNRVYFGNILGVEGFDDVAGFKCTKCKIPIQVQRKTMRASTLPKSNA